MRRPNTVCVCLWRLLPLPVLYCCVTMFNTFLFVILMLDARGKWGGGVGGSRHRFLLFKLNIKQHFVDNYCSFQPSLHKTQFRAAQSLQGIHAVVLFSTLLCAEWKSEVFWFLQERWRRIFDANPPSFLYHWHSSEQESSLICCYNHRLKELSQNNSLIKAVFMHPAHDQVRLARRHFRKPL